MIDKINCRNNGGFPTKENVFEFLKFTSELKHVVYVCMLREVY